MSKVWVIGVLSLSRLGINGFRFVALTGSSENVFWLRLSWFRAEFEVHGQLFSGYKQYAL